MKKRILISGCLIISICIIIRIVVFIADAFSSEIYIGDNTNGVHAYGILENIIGQSEVLVIDENGELLHRNESNNSLQLFYFIEEKNGLKAVLCEEYDYRAGKYYLRVDRKTTFEPKVQGEHSVINTVLADASTSFSPVRPSDLNARPLWGVTDSESVQNMTITGQPVDDVIKFTTSEGKDYYLWIIDNYVGGDDQESMVIELE